MHIFSVWMILFFVLSLSFHRRCGADSHNLLTVGIYLRLGKVLINFVKQPNQIIASRLSVRYYSPQAADTFQLNSLPFFKYHGHWNLKWIYHWIGCWIWMKLADRNKWRENMKWFSNQGKNRSSEGVGLKQLKTHYVVTPPQAILNPTRVWKGLNLIRVREGG